MLGVLEAHRHVARSSVVVWPIVVERRDCDGDGMEPIARARKLVETEPAISPDKQANESGGHGGQYDCERVRPHPPRAAPHGVLPETNGIRNPFRLVPAR